MLKLKIQVDQYPRLFYAKDKILATISHVVESGEQQADEELFSAVVTYNDKGDRLLTIYLSEDARIIKCNDKILYTTEARDDKSKETEGNEESLGEESEEDTRL